MKNIFTIPDEEDIENFFGAGPREHVENEGYWEYEYQDPDGLSLVVSFHEQEQSFQTSLFYKKIKVFTVSNEGAEKLVIENRANGKAMICRFSQDKADVKVEIMLKPRISVNWSGLILEE